MKGTALKRRAGGSAGAVAAMAQSLRKHYGATAENACLRLEFLCAVVGIMEKEERRGATPRLRRAAGIAATGLNAIVRASRGTGRIMVRAE